MMFMQKIIFLLTLFASTTLAAIPENYAQNSLADLRPNIQNLGYSHNQRHLVVLQKDGQDGFFVYDGIKLSDGQHISINDQVKGAASPCSFAFSQKDDLLVIGTQEGGVYGYKIVNNKVEQDYSYNFTFGTKEQSFGVKAISIDADNKIAVSFKNFFFVLSVPTSIEGTPTEFKPELQKEFSHGIECLCWSILQPNLIFVSIIGQSSGNFALFDTQGNNSLTPINEEKVLSIALSSDGSTLFKSTFQKNIDVYAYQKGGLPKYLQSITETNSSKQIQISQNGQYFAAQTNGGRVMAWRIVSQSSTNLKAQQTQLQLSFSRILNEAGENLAITETGNDILIAPTGGSTSAKKFSLCFKGIFFNPETGECSGCSENCAECFTEEVCISCNNDKFIDGDVCSKCDTKLEGCVTCQSGEQCLTCDEDAFWKDQAEQGKCVCMDTYYNNQQGKCAQCSAFLDCINCVGEDNCTLCKEQDNFRSLPEKGKCVCENSFWLNQTKCLQCSKSIPDCLQCSQDGNQCTKCQSEDKKPNQDQSKCVCVDYKYEDPQGQCQDCDQYNNCLECNATSPDQCLKCDQNKERKQNPQEGKCVCKDGFYDSVGSCKSCSESIVDCFTCQNENVCSTCKNESNFNPSPVGGKCICNEGWILDENSCKLCSEQITGCSICDSVTKCKTCRQDKDFVKEPTDDGKCICQSTHWLNNTVCEFCSTKVPGCSQCSGDGQKCFSCSDQNRRPSPDGKSCVCKDFFYQDEDQKCQQCDTKQACLHCNQTTPNHECIECDSKNNWNITPSEGQCKCQTGYNEYNEKCLYCSVPGCIQCQSQTTCIHCDQTKLFEPLAQKDQCKCIYGAYKAEDLKSCELCSIAILGCKNCDNKNQCAVCDGESHFTNDMTNYGCRCEDSYYLKNNESCEQCSIPIPNCDQCVSMGTSGLQCKKCLKGWGTSDTRKSCINCNDLSVGCLDCTDSTHCKQCDEDNSFVPNGTLCACKDKFYLKEKKCEACSQAIPGCVSCSNQQTCTLCSNEGKFDPKPNYEHKCSCLEGWTIKEGICVSCDQIPGCLACTDINTCTKCNSDKHFVLNDQHMCECNQTFWLNGTTCQECTTAIYDCKQCSQNGKICTQCQDSNRELNADKTSCNCKKFMYEDLSRICKFCDQYQSCQSCVADSQHKCLTCDISGFWNLKPNPDGVCYCQPHYAEFNHKCVQCDIVGCKECQQANTCSLCDQSKKFISQPNQGQCKCQPNTLLDQGSCYFCNQKLPGCKKCQTFTQCEKCQTENFFVLNTKTKKCECDQSHYFVEPNCEPCSTGISNCAQCTINTQKQECSKCAKGFEPSDDNKACLSCKDHIPGCVDCSENTCQQCDGQHNFVIDGTVCTCNIGFFMKLKQCVQCSQPLKGCVECNTDGTECSKCNGKADFVFNKDQKKCDCADGYYLNVDQCSMCYTLIPGCKSCSQNGAQCLSCGEGYFLEQGKCQLCSSTIPGCTTCNENGSKCSKCNETAQFVINKDTQTCDCIQQFYLNDDKKCALCSSKLAGCKLCNQQGSQCSECNTGEHFSLNNETNQCDCEKSFFLSDKKKCELCDTKINGCQECNQEGSKCSQCKTTQHFIVDDSTSKCICTDGYFQNKNKCQLCQEKNPGCTKCSRNGEECLSCDTEAGFVYDDNSKLCQCKDTYYVSSISQCKLCNDAIKYCVDCESEGQQFTPLCSTCKSGFLLSPNKNSCYCMESDNKEIVDGECVDKASSNWIMFAIIGGASIVVIGAAVYIYMKCKKARSRMDLYEEMEDEETGHKRKKQETILTSQHSNNLVKSSGSLDIDE